jgi:hypothetical protein
VAWLANLNDFRSRSLVERLFWSLPLSFSLSTILSVLIGKFLSIEAVAILLYASAVLSLGIITCECVQLQRAVQKIRASWNLGTSTFLIALLWVAIAVGLLVDLQSGQNLFPSLTIFDHSMRVSWIESVTRTGVPPMNPLYMDQHPSPMRYYYFWYVLCAAVARMWHLPARAVLTASCVWSGFSLPALAGLYIKHFLHAGVRVRAQFLRAIGLLCVTGLGFLVNIWDVLHRYQPIPGSLEVWKAGQITSWFNSLLWVPHHVASMVCCMFGFLLAWMAIEQERGPRSVTILLMAASFASAFGLSIYVAFAFFVLAVAWAVWLAATERTFHPTLLFAASGFVALLLLFPYLWELTHTASSVGGGTGSVFEFAVRETIPPEGLLGSDLMRGLAHSHPVAARNVANLLLLVPGYAVELGFYFPVLLIYLIPAWRGRKPLSRPQRSLVFIAIATLVMVSFLRSSVIESNDFGWRGALFPQFILLLFASELLTQWKLSDDKHSAPADAGDLPGPTPQLLRAVVSVALIFGVLTTLCQALIVRFTIPFYELQLRVSHNPRAGFLPHKAYISEIGYSQLDAAIPASAVVQYNAWTPDGFWLTADWLGVGHQSAIDSNQGSCGAEFGGDLRGCPIMAAAIDALYKDATAEQARTTCRLYGIDYLVSRSYDPAWNDKNSWVWTLTPVVSDGEFRAVRCNQ